MFFLKSTLRDLLYAALIYILFGIAYGQVHAAQCIAFITVWTHGSATQTSALTARQMPIFATTATPSTCALLALTGSEYQALIDNQAVLQGNITTVNNNVTTANNNATTALNSANQALTNATTANNNAITANTNANTAFAKAQEALDLSPVNNVDNILNINSQDANTLMYALLGLFIIAFVGRMYRKSISISDNSSSE